MRRALILLVALGGCTQYAHRSMHNAPGIADLDTPPQREVGDPKAFEEPTQPGSETYTVVALPNIILGEGRFDTGRAATEVGIGFRVERLADKNGALLKSRAWAITAGVGFAQISPSRPTIFGATFVEANYRFFLEVPIDVGLGGAVYPGVNLPATGEHYDPSVGGQLSVRLPLLLVRSRYMTETGFEIMVGPELPIPFFFGRSR